MFVLSLAIVLLLGALGGWCAQKIGLPRIVGMLLVGIGIGPACLNLLDASFLAVSADIRQIALIIILLKAGLNLDFSDVKKVGVSAMLLSFVPATFEIIAYTIFAHFLLKLSFFEAMLMGTVLAAVSPAVVVPKMVSLIEEKYGTKQCVPQMIMAGASCDDIFVLVLFGICLSVVQSGKIGWTSLLDLPLSIGSGVLLGLLFGIFFLFVQRKEKTMAYSLQMVLALALGFLAMGVETLLKPVVAVSGLLAVMSMAMWIRKKEEKKVALLSKQATSLWSAAEILLFVLVGAAVQIEYIAQVGWMSVVVIVLSLCVRCVGVWIALLPSKLSKKEKQFCLFAYLPKATVQAAIGAVPLAMGLACGKSVLSLAVLGILITAPLGAIAMELTYKKLLIKEE
ncbi:cation:proton antiporter [Dubosiella newyorkensis]|uniref:cation:proton antiporter n=1 Tax=Dubosiella newyorkensis TaxID=1862672 RepID=UPI00272D2340|nr:cation:proton antiporter [Dubosiella newyorkensis]